jgi:hypothetical protein
MGRAMSVDTSDGHPAMDYPEHRRTYAGFVRGVEIVVALVVVTLILMAIFLT